LKNVTRCSDDGAPVPDLGCLTCILCAFLGIKASQFIEEDTELDGIFGTFGMFPRWSLMVRCMRLLDSLFLPVGMIPSSCASFRGFTRHHRRSISIDSQSMKYLQPDASAFET
jgi:hypothetical protein